jgi:hypothetical protein
LVVGGWWLVRVPKLQVPKFAIEAAQESQGISAERGTTTRTTNGER